MVHGSQNVAKASTWRVGCFSGVPLPSKLHVSTGKLGSQVPLTRIHNLCFAKLGDPVTCKALAENPKISAVSFVGSSRVAVP